MFVGFDVIEPCGKQGVTMPRCYRLDYLNFISGDLTNTSSHICGSWYLPLFLFREGSFTLINIASLMVLAMFWSSLPTMLKLSRDTSWPLMLWLSWIGDGTFMCSLNLSAKVLPDSSMYSSSVCPATLKPMDHSTLLQDGISVFWAYQEVLDGITSFEVHINPMLSTNVLTALPHALNVWDNYVWPVVVAFLVGCIGCPLISVNLLSLMDVGSR